MLEFRLLCADEIEAAAALHQRGATQIPGFDPTRQAMNETTALYRQAFERGAIWGAFDRGTLVGLLALEPGWIEHLYVEPSHKGGGIGRALVRLAQSEQDDLQLYTWQSNRRARQLYEMAGFVVEEFGVDPTDEHRAPNVRYRWRRTQEELA